MPQNFRWDGDDAVWRQQCAKEVCISERIDDPKLGQHASRQAEIHADRSHMAAAHAATGADH